MENRFGVKDFFLFLLLITLIIVIVFAMKQYDRQYQIVRDIDQQGRDQLRELVAIHNALDRGVPLGAPATQAAIPESQDPFYDLRVLRAQGKYDEGDWFVGNMPALIEKLTPIISTSLYSQGIVCRVVETLAYPDTNAAGKYHPLLAKSWQISPDGLTITFQLRPGVTFSDGVAMTADDVVYSYNELGNNPKIDGPAYRQQFERCESCTKLSDMEVQFKFKEPYYQSFDAVGASLFILPKHFYSKFTIDQFNNSVGLLMGTGPYRMADPTAWKPNPGKIELLRNERYWGLSPSFNKLVYTQIQQESTEVVNFTNGDLDAISVLPPAYRQLLARPDIVARSNHYDFNSVQNGYSYIAWNQVRGGKPTLFADKRVRQAMTMLTNREGFCKTIMYGYAVPAPGPYPSFSDQHDSTLEDWEFNPPKAKALLKEVGFEDRGHGVLELADGTQLSFKLTYPSKIDTIDRIMRYIQDDYSRAGVRMELDPIDFTILLQRIKTREYAALSMGWGGGSMEDDIYQEFHSSQMEGDGDDFMSYKNPEMDKAIEAARRTIDTKARMELWHKCDRILHEDQPYTFLMDQKRLLFIDKRIEGLKLTKAGTNLVGNWCMPVPYYVPGPKQKYH
jgi:peptide/nickel transport system substrate-binding protein